MRADVGSDAIKKLRQINDTTVFEEYVLLARDAM
jgi:hypothetical protein